MFYVKKALNNIRNFTNHSFSK